MQDVFKEEWQQGRNDLLPEDPNFRKSREKLRSQQDKKKHCQKDLGKWAGDSERIRNEVQEKHAKMKEEGKKILEFSVTAAELD